MDKKYYNIDEISNIINEKKHTIRFWEDRIENLNILRTQSGHRLYNYQNLLTLKKIQYLINIKKLTLDGVSDHFKKKKNNKFKNQDIYRQLQKILESLKLSVK